MFAACKDFILHWHDIQGQTTRRAFWLVCFALALLTLLEDGIFFAGYMVTPLEGWSSLSRFYGRVLLIEIMVLAIPGCTLLVRRLRDTGRSSVWLWLVLLPGLLLAAIMVLGQNRLGLGNGSFQNLWQSIVLFLIVGLGLLIFLVSLSGSEENISKNRVVDNEPEDWESFEEALKLARFDSSCEEAFEAVDLSFEELNACFCKLFKHYNNLGLIELTHFWGGLLEMLDILRVWLAEARIDPQPALRHERLSDCIGAVQDIEREIQHNISEEQDAEQEERLDRQKEEALLLLKRIHNQLDTLADAWPERKIIRDFL